MAEETFYKRMLDNLYDGVYFVDIDRKISFWNKGAERITGFISEEVLGSHCYNNILNHIDIEGNRLCYNGCPLHKTIVDGELRESEVFLHHKDGHRVPVFVRTMPYYEDDKIIGAVEIFVDNSERLEIMNQVKKLEILAMKDELSGLPNRRYGQEFIASKMNEFKNLGIDFGIAFLDIDNFKHVNDTYGHDIGDEVIKMIANTCTASLRKWDMMIRWGGEEFVIVFVGILPDQLEMVAEKVRFLIGSSALRKDGYEVKPTVSIGATMARSLDTSTAIVNRADSLMYQSKIAGKNRVTIE